mgnify:CR=1 FL=1
MVKAPQSAEEAFSRTWQQVRAGHPVAEVVAAYPISPQTHIVEGLSDLVRTGELAPCEYLMVESEFASMSACVGASAAGARTYTATASQGPKGAVPLPPLPRDGRTVRSLPPRRN